MPTYEYACRDCGEHLEVVQSFKDDALTVCPNCEGTLRKVFSAAGIIFKGSGWHIKDYGGSTSSSSGSGGSSEGDSTSAGADGGSKTSSSGDSSKTSAGSEGSSSSSSSTSTTSAEKSA